MHSETNNGAFTGEISAEMLAQICQYVIVGHSERRTYFSETDLFINLKLLAALSAGITPILCVGEKREDRDSGRAHDIVSSQLDANLNGMDLNSKIVVAYEPVWAIGTGQSASPEIAQDMMFHIREILADLFGNRSETIPLLYGGSVNEDNIGVYVSQADIDGALVGGASLNAGAFCRLIANASRTER
jgi:triosephosphate isomerase